MAELSLRDLLRGPIVGLSQRFPHSELPSICESLGLPTPGVEGSKRERIEASYAAASDTDLPRVAENVLRFFPPSADLRNRIQDVIWTGISCPEIPKRYRHELSRNLSAEDLYLDAGHLEALLDRFWVIDDDPFAELLSGHPTGLRAEIHQHVFRNPGDWSVEYLFERLGAFECSDYRFVLFLEGLASADVRPDVDNQTRFVQLVNKSLRPCNVELRETGMDGGYPVFEVAWVSSGVQGKPKNLIFASQIKPDLRFRDAVNNDVEIVSNADTVLVYDRAISSGGLLWRDLQDWWAQREQLSADVAKKTLYRRLLASLPPNSPPQRLVFENYFSHFGHAIPVLPALLPEVWLHWDPKTAKQRGRDALLRFRMDFLMLLPNNIRVVIEVDGRHHYADENGESSPRKYAAMASADREVSLAGYDVYHFGASELSGESAGPVVADFFERLFKLHHVTLPNSEARSGRSTTLNR
jgi:very-short-patch-repair endonuclease